jgi:hypothetical protein
MVTFICGIALSLHMGLVDDYNYKSIHPYCKAKTESNVIAGAYYNSIGKLSVFTGYEYNINKDTSIEVGIATGYYYSVTPTARLNYKNLFLMPAIDDNKPGLVVGIQYKF